MKILLGFLLVVLSIASAKMLLAGDPVHNLMVLTDCVVLAAVGAYLIREEP